MATITTGGGGGLLRTLGDIAILGGALIPGAQWLTPLGTAMGAANSIMNGGAGGVSGQQGGLGGLMEALTGIAQTIGGGSITGKNNQTQTPKTDEQLNKEWSFQNPYAHYIYGGNAWQR